jgi:septum formation protein
VILASSSPRRAELLRAAGILFDIRPVEVDERFHPAERLEDAVVRVAKAKATIVAAIHTDALVLAADTTVVVDGEALGKPADLADASRMLKRLSGRTHDVLTGVCLCGGGDVLTHVESSRVQMAALSDEEIAWYVATGEPVDKAGAYGIQGLASRFVERIDGSYSNVVGLPISCVYGLLKRLGCDILRFTEPGNIATVQERYDP